MTVTSVSSLSVDPPTLIVCINRESSSWPLVKRHGFFGVNILNADQLDVAERFTGKGGLKGAERFAGAEWITLASGVPLLVGALAVSLSRNMAPMWGATRPEVRRFRSSCSLRTNSSGARSWN